MAVIKKRPTTFPTSFEELEGELRRKYLWYTPSPIYRIAYLYGIGVTERVLTKGIHGSISVVSGFYNISISALLCYSISRFVLARCLAHLLLHRKIIDRLGHIDVGPFTFYLAPINIEEEANKFALDLLVPESTFDEFILAGTNRLSLLKEIFEVSPTVLQLRDIHHRINYEN